MVDRTTRRPVIGAKVVLTSHPASEQTQTDPDGSFRLAGFRHPGFFLLPHHMFIPATGYLQIEAAGYKPYAQPELGGSSAPGYITRDSLGQAPPVRITLAPVGSRYKSGDGNDRNQPVRSTA